MKFVKGQRFISETEPELGLGSVVEFNHRMVKIHFGAINEFRIYASETAPISRVEFAIDDKVSTQAGDSVKIIAKQSVNGLIAYLCELENGEETTLLETEFAHNIKFNKPGERLLSGHIDSIQWFETKLKAYQYQSGLKKNPLFGLLGCRTSLLKHQLYIAHNVGQRHSPRVLLADEVGLGKTIEAGLILHQQLLTNRAKRVVVIVPESLKHQWMVEMLRRFNLSFSVYDESLCQAVEASTQLQTPFESSQLALVSLDFLKSHSTRFEQLLATQWDLMIVDEAHHLQWSEENPSTEYQLIEQLTQSIPGVLLLTATPEQLGRESHFARLKLLDPNRFYDFNTFLKEEEKYQPLAELIEALSQEKPLNSSQKSLLKKTLGLKKFSQNDTKEVSNNSQQWVNKLLDLHGTGRLLFRNTRSAIKGFPQRVLHAYPLKNHDENLKQLPALQQLTPERFREPEQTIAEDLRFGWLVDKIKELKQKKILLITTHKQTVLELAEALRTKQGIHAAVFHEGLSLIDRDKAAAWFADLEEGAQILLCSEIGSEGRNFQFAHHAIFFDLPLNPDLLEQRIGRLDRIGQTHPINIHVPYFENTSQQKLFEYHHHGLGVFEKICPAAFYVFQQTKNQLLEQMSHSEYNKHDEFSKFIHSVSKLTSEENQNFDQGRDRLLEFNSCREPDAEQLLQKALNAESSNCQKFMHKVFELFGVHYEDLRHNIELIRPGDSLQEPFPGLLEEGMSITFDRATALANETLHYLSWEHPMVQESLERVTNHEKGNACVAVLQGSGLRPSSLLLQANFHFQIIADAKLQGSRFEAGEIISCLFDETSKNHESLLKATNFASRLSEVDEKTSIQIIKMKADSIKQMLKSVEQWSQTQQDFVAQKASRQAEEKLDLELQRITELKQNNPNIREEEITFIENQKKQLLQAIQTSHLQLVSLRLFVCV